MVSLLGSIGGTTFDIIFYDCAREYQWSNVTSVLKRLEVGADGKALATVGHDSVLEQNGDSGHSKAKNPAKFFASGRKKTCWSTSSPMPHFSDLFTH